MGLHGLVRVLCSAIDNGLIDGTMFIEHMLQLWLGPHEGEPMHMHANKDVFLEGLHRRGEIVIVGSFSDGEVKAEVRILSVTLVARGILQKFKCCLHLA